MLQGCWVAGSCPRGGRSGLVGAAGTSSPTPCPPLPVRSGLAEEEGVGVASEEGRGWGSAALRGRRGRGGANLDREAGTRVGSGGAAGAGRGGCSERHHVPKRKCTRPGGTHVALAVTPSVP